MFSAQGPAKWNHCVGWALRKRSRAPTAVRAACSKCLAALAPPEQKRRLDLDAVAKIPLPRREQRNQRCPGELGQPEGALRHVEGAAEKARPDAPPALRRAIDLEGDDTPCPHVPQDREPVGRTVADTQHERARAPPHLVVERARRAIGFRLHHHGDLRSEFIRKTARHRVPGARMRGHEHGTAPGCECSAQVLAAGDGDLRAPRLIAIGTRVTPQGTRRSP